MGSELGVTADSKSQLNLDSVGVWWISWAGFWTLLVLCGMGYLLVNRRSQILRIRGIGLSLSAVVLLHLYWFSVQLGYVVGAVSPAEAEYWIMGTYLPLGIALFHASNSRFLYVARAQQKYLSRLLSRPGKRPSRGLFGRFNRWDFTTKMVVLVGLGMCLQLFLAIFMYLISRKFHSGWGIPGTEVDGTEMEQRMRTGRGWEWWPSIFWQVIWAWFVAPCILWKSRNIRDTHGWRVQTIGCALAGLHATPMWLIALYVPAMEPVNRYVLPPQWIALSIWALEILTVFLPCWEVYSASNLRQETLDSIAQWESKNKAAASGTRSLRTASTVMESLMTGLKSTAGSVKSTDSQESILTMSALEYVLERNPAPLQEFSCLRDFSGENIAFLTCVAEWKSSLPASARCGVNDESARELVRERFNRALRIYAEFVSIKDAEFPLNLASAELGKLQAVFEPAARTLYSEKRDVDAAVPFGISGLPPAKSKSCAASSQGSEKEASGGGAEDRVQYWGEIPDSFDEKVFDDAEKDVKYLVLTNTWPKFVKDRRSLLDSETAETGRLILGMFRGRHK